MDDGVTMIPFGNGTVGIFLEFFVSEDPDSEKHPAVAQVLYLHPAPSTQSYTGRTIEPRFAGELFVGRVDVMDNDTCEWHKAKVPRSLEVFICQRVTESVRQYSKRNGLECNL